MATLRKRRGRWQAMVRRKGATPETATFDTKAAADRWARRIEGEIDQGRAKGTGRVIGTLGDLLERYELERRKERPLRRSLEHILGQLDKGLGATLLGKLTAERVLSYCAGRRKAGAGPVTVGMDLSILGTVLRSSHALMGFKIDLALVSDAREALKAARLIRKSRERDRRPTQEELDRLMAYFRGKQPRQKVPMWDIIAFAVATAMRREEITRVAWADLDESLGTVLIRDRKDPEEKEGNDEVVPLLDKAGYDALALALAQPRSAAEIFPFRPETVTTIFARACGELRIEDLRFHDLRHEGISRMFEAKMAIEEVAICSGHKDWRTLRRYTHIKGADLARKYRAPPPPAKPPGCPDGTGPSGAT